MVLKPEDQILPVCLCEELAQTAHTKTQEIIKEMKAQTHQMKQQPKKRKFKLRKKKRKKKKKNQKKSLQFKVNDVVDEIYRRWLQRRDEVESKHKTKKTLVLSSPY